MADSRQLAGCRTQCTADCLLHPADCEGEAFEHE
jgi:hypothetical protein